LSTGNESVWHETLQSPLVPADYPSSCQIATSGAVYTVFGYKDSLCASYWYIYHFKKSTEAADCYVLTGADGGLSNGEMVGFSYALSCEGSLATWERFDGTRCEGAAVARGGSPWSWYTASECTSHSSFNLSNGNESVWHETLRTPLVPGDYPSSCGDSSHVGPTTSKDPDQETQVSFGNARATLAGAAVLPAVVCLAAT